MPSTGRSARPPRRPVARAEGWVPEREGLRTTKAPRRESRRRVADETGADPKAGGNTVGASTDEPIRSRAPIPCPMVQLPRSVTAALLGVALATGTAHAQGRGDPQLNNPVA